MSVCEIIFQQFKMAVHAAMVDRMDREIGRVMSQLREMEAYEDTVVIFLSDNGATGEQIVRGDEHDPDAAPGSAPTYLALGPGWSTAANRTNLRSNGGNDQQRRRAYFWGRLLAAMQ